jgi:hypothetical protein
MNTFKKPEASKSNVPGNIRGYTLKDIYDHRVVKAVLLTNLVLYSYDKLSFNAVLNSVNDQPVFESRDHVFKSSSTPLAFRLLW